MKIVKLSSLSEKERKKVLEEQEERYQQNLKESQRMQKEANDEFVKKFGNGVTQTSHTYTHQDMLNVLESKEERDRYRKAHGLTLWEQVKSLAGDIGRIGQNTGEGVSGGIKDLLSAVYRARQDEIKSKNESYAKIDEMLSNSKNKNARVIGQKMLEKDTAVINKVNENIENFDEKRKEEKAESQQKISENIAQQSNPITGKIAELAPSIGNMGVGMVASAVNPIVGTAYFTGSASGSYYYDALDRGMTREQAEKYGNIMGALEGITEMVGVSNIQKGGKAIKTLVAGSGKQALKTATKETVKTGLKEGLKNFGIGIVDNFMQESIMEPLQELTAQTTGGNDKANWDNMGQRMLQSGIDGALTSIIMSGAEVGTSSCVGLVEKIQNKKSITQQEVQQAVKDARENGVDVQKLTEDSLMYERDKIINKKEDNQVINQETKTSQNQTSQAQNDAKTQTTNNLAKVRQFYDEDTYNQMKNFIETAPSEEALNQINEDIKTETKNRLEETYKSEKFTESQDRKRTYAQYQRQNNTTGINYDNSVVDNALDAVAPNRNGRRTVGQWKQVAEQIGLNATDLTKSQIDDIAYGSWFDLQPTKNITKYDNRTKEHKGFEKFTSDDWINTIYETAKGQKLQKLDTVLNQSVETAQEQNLVTPKDNSEVMNEVQDYIKNNNLDMTTDEFVEWASNVELENEENMTQEQKELYSLIDDIQNRTSGMYNENNVDFDKNTYLDYNNKEKNITDSMLSAYSVDNRVEEYFRYNHTDKFYNLTYEEMEKASSVVSDRISENNNGIANDDKYIYYYDSENNDAKNYTITDILEIKEGREEIADERNIDRNSRRSISKGIRQNSSIGDNQSTRYNTTSEQNTTMDSKQSSSESERNNKKSTRNKQNIENSKESSFSIVDNQGRQLSKQQQQHFKRSKVRDRLGRLLEVYHGTPTKGFTIYDESKLGANTSSKDSGIGFHFSDNIYVANNVKNIVGQNLIDKATKKVYEIYDISQNEVLPPDFNAQINLEIVELAQHYAEENGEIKKQYLNIEKPFSIFADYGISEEQLANDLAYIVSGEENITDSELGQNFENNKDFLLALQQNFDNERAEFKDFLSTETEALDRLKELGYDGIIFPLQETDQATLASQRRNGKNVTLGGNEYIVFNSNQIKNVDNLNPTDNPDIRYELEDHSDNTAQNEIQRKINRSMTMKEAEDMIQRAFVAGNIYDWYDGKYKNGNEWLQGEGAEDVSMWIENDYNLQNKYINSNEDILNEEYTIDDVIEAYQNNALTGNEEKQTQRLDTSKDTGYKDDRFFAPKEVKGGKELYDLASQRVTNKNRNEVYKARADFIINAHNEGYVDSLGLSQKEINEAIRKWSAYPVKARNISGYINQGVATENKWVGIENSSIVNEISVSSEQLDSLVKEVKGTSNEYQRRYIVNTMLALDTHLDYKGLTYDFAPNVEKMGERALADYSPETDTIRVRREGLNTIAHETGHYIDQLLGREIGDGYNLGITTLCRANFSKELTSQQKQFLNNFSNFLTSIEDVSDIGSTYKMSSNEVFARFVARFVEWTRNTATGNRYGYEADWYKDNFTQPQYVEFAKLLQEYSLLKTTNQVSEKVTRGNKRIYDQRIEDIYAELNKKKKQEIKAPMKGNVQQSQENTKVKFDNEVMKTNSEIKGNSETSEKVAKILSEPTKNVKPEQRTWAILKANFIDKGAVFEKISQKTNNRDLQGKYDYTLTAGARGQYAIGNDRYVYTNGKKTLQSKSLTSIMDEVGENTQAFNEYMYHQLNVDRMTLDERFGIENKPVFGESITADVSRAEIAKIEEQHPEFKKYANDVYKYLEANKQELVDRGVISQETSDFFKERYPHYVPIQRATRKGDAIGVPLDTKRTGINSPIKKAKGGNQDINPLFQTMASQTLQTYRASARNNFGLELKNTLQQMNQLNENRNIADIDDIVDTMTNEEQNNELLQPGKKGENPTFTVFEDGKKITYDISQDMYDALKPKSEILNKLDNTKLAKAGRKISNFRRGVLTEYNPIFSITNALKDAQDVLINSQHSAKTYAKFPEAYAQIVKKGYWYNEYIQNGGEQNSYFTEGDFENIKKTKLDKAKNVLKIPFEKISSINNVIEMAPRLAEYIVSRQNGASIETAMLDASRVTTNFKAGGDITKFANRNGATFLNASVQGFQQQVRNIQEANMKGLKGWTNLALKYTVAGLPALLLNNLFWDDDDDYEQLQDYVKDNYYVIAKLSNGNFLRIPKGRMVATIQKIVSNANDFVKDGKINSDDVARTIWNDLKEDVSFGMDNLAPNNPIDNNILSPIIQVAQNRTWYGDDLVPQRLQNVPDAEQADETTDKFSRWLGDKLNVSPMKINYLLDQYSGGIGDVLLPLGTPQAENNVIEDKFTTDPVMKSQYPSDFFSKADELTVKNNSLKATDEDKLKYKYISSIQKDISELYKKKREIQSSEKTDEEKKKELKEIQKQINDFAKDGLNNVDKLNISGNTATIGDKEYYKVNDTWNVISKDKKIEGISLSTYSDYQNRLAKEKSKLSKEKSLTEKDKNKVLLDSNYTSKEKKTIYKATTGKNDELYDNLSKLTDVNINAYLEYKLQDIKGDEDTKSNIVGKTKSGSKKANVKEYIINSNLSGIEKLYIYGKNYKFDKTEKYSMINYLAKSNLSKEDKQQIIKGLSANVEQHKDGNYYWK